MHRSIVRKIAGVAGSAALLAAVPVVAPLAGAEPGTPPPVDERRVLTTEHVDAMNVGVDGDRLTLNSKISPPVEYIEPDDLIFQLSDLARIDGLPPQYAEFLGADFAWIVEQTQNPEVIWAGWSTEDIGTGVLDGDAVDITLTDMRGPGQVEVWQTVGFGDIERIFSSDEDHKTLRQGVNAHVHANWAFTQAGVYTLTFTATGSVGGQLVTSDPVDYTWVVGGDNGALPAPAVPTTTVQAPQNVTVGDEVVLEAAVTTDTGSNAPPAPGGYVEFHDGATSLGWTSITDGVATLPVTFDAPGEHSVTATYTSQEPQFYTASTAEPVTVTVSEGDVEPPQTTLTVTGPDGPVLPGAAVTLGVAQDPATDLTVYQWSTRAPGALTFEPVDGATTDTLTVTATAADDGRQYRAALFTDDGIHVAVSAPFTLTVEEDDPGTEDGNDAGTEDGNDPPDQCEDPRTMLTDEHVDLLAPVLDGSALELRAKVGTAADHTYYDPADLLVQVKDPEAVATVPGGADYAFLGDVGDSLWMIPQTQDPEIVWAGWSTEDLPAGALAGDAVQITLTDVVGPGELEVFQTAGLGAAPTRIFSSVDALEPRDKAVGQHVHANWAFTALGEYTLTFEVTGTLASGATVTTGEVDYAVVVGAPDCDPDDPGDESGGDESGGDESGGDQSGGDTSGGDGGDAAGTDDGAEQGGSDSGDAGGVRPDPTAKPTTKPTGDVCVPRSAASVRNTPSGSGTPGGGTSGESVVLTNEHVDLIAPVFDGGRLGLQAKVGTAADHTFYDPADVLVQVVPAAESTIPSGDAYAFLGSPGAPLWLIPETQNPDVVWAGWSTEGLAAGTFAGDAVAMRLVSAEGPGAVEVFQTTGFGDVSRIFSSEESLPARQQSVGQHVHANWAFSAEGNYTLSFEVSATTAGGQSVTTGPVAYSFVVGERSGAGNAAASAGGVAAQALYRTDATPTATASHTPTASPTSSVVAADDCDLASTGASGTLALAVFGGLLLTAGAVAIGAHRRDRRPARG